MARVRVGNRCFLFQSAIFAGVLWFTPFAIAQNSSVPETTQEINERVQRLSATARNVPHDYIIGRGDLLNITVFDVPELNRDVRVSQTGTIALPLVHVRISITGLTELQAEQKIAEVLEANGLVSHPEVSVVVKEHRSKPITIVGAVGHPMVYEADHPVTLVEALAEAGGIANDAGDTILVTRARAATFVEIPGSVPVTDQPPPGAGEPPAVDNTPETPSQAPAEEKPPTENAPLFPGPPDAAQNAGTPANSGSSNASTGNPSASPNSPITINLNQLLESGDMRNNIPLQAGDIVTVPHAGIIYVLGAVGRPGGFVVNNDRTEFTVLKLLSLAGGYTRIAKLDQAVIIRKDSQGKQTSTQIDLKKILHREAEDLQMRASDILYVPDSRTKEVVLRTVELAIGVGTTIAIWHAANQ